jgi:hypothetical protein
MNAAMIRTLLRLYPRNWRDRYEEEFVALLEQQPATFAACADVAFGAAIARCRAIGLANNNLSDRMVPTRRALRIQPTDALRDEG